PESVSPLKRLLLKWNMRSSLSRADCIVTASAYMENELVEYYGIFKEKVRVIHHSIDPTRFHPNLDPARAAHICRRYGVDGDYILYMGALEPRKNLARLIDAYAVLVERMGDKAPRLVLAGRRGFRHEHLEKHVASCQLEDRVVFCGYVAEKDKPYLLRGARLFAFPSLSEGVCAPVLEAMACGTPVLTSHVAALPEVCDDAPLYVDPESTDSIRDGLFALLTDDALRETCIERGLLRASSPIFSREKNAEKLYGVYRELCEKD
ncbi:MAG: glycosyltransferase family 4 protein, partial [Clostridia bacterium]|nr:glycosyltransferase family 4 protein [Clostridia bacterium]